MKQKQLLIQIDNSRSGAEYYAPCFSCQKHPNYPQAPMTLHRGNQCLICLDSPDLKEKTNELA